MKCNLLSPDRDPMGRAIMEHLEGVKGGRIRVFSSQFDEDEILLSQLFRKYSQMPKLEKRALKMATGKILDVGSGSGCHSLALQEMGKSVTAIDISTLSIEAAQRQGVKSAINIDLFDPTLEGAFDTILMLMNGSGIVGKVENLPTFFSRIRELLAPNGVVLMDSSDLKYLFEEEDGSYVIDLNDNYYGEIDFQMQYKDTLGGRFDWLYIDFQTLSLYAEQNGFEASLIAQGEHYDYLASLRVK